MTFSIPIRCKFLKTFLPSTWQLVCFRLTRCTTADNIHVVYSTNTTIPNLFLLQHEHHSASLNSGVKSFVVGKHACLFYCAWKPRCVCRPDFHTLCGPASRGEGEEEPHPSSTEQETIFSGILVIICFSQRLTQYRGKGT